MAEKCVLCREKIEETFLDKIKGTIVNVKKGERNEKNYVCSSCQRLNADLHKAVRKE